MYSFRIRSVRLMEAQVVKHLPNNCEILSLNPCSIKKKKAKKKERKEEKNEKCKGII
jgi:hypothetical protein